MSKEKQIEEMAKDVASTQIGTIKLDLTPTELGEVYKGEFVLRIAKHLYNAGYRKASEVAREIFEEIKKIACVYKLDGDFYIDNGLYAELKKKYTGVKNDN